ncbi:hypothetical protein FQN57_000325 [Myotisia sp. PD_48]|nr:hypothetical protein FQN57_000325 [Myotisia sp. PD_48]
MSEFNGRRAPNFTQYLNDLNTIQPAYDQGLRQEQELFDVDAELALFTNAEFLDFDPAGDMSANARPVKFREEQTSSESSPAQEVNYLDMLNGEFRFSTLPHIGAVLSTS